MRAAGGLSLERRAPRARRRRRPAVPRRTRSWRTSSSASSPSSTSGAAAIAIQPDLVGRGPLPGGPRPRPATSSRIARPWRTTCDEALAAPATASASGSTAPPSRARTTCSTCRTRGPEATWLGAQSLKNPLDLWVYQEIIVETRAELIVETGTYRGGSAFFLASICDLLGAGEVVSIDVEPVRDDYPAHPRITYLGGRSSTDPDVVAEVRARAEGKRTLVILDSDHSQAHVEAELAEYAGLVPVGGYVIVEDSNIGQIRKDLLPGPLEAIETFLARTDAFEIDREREKFLITFNPSGYLRRVRVRRRRSGGARRSTSRRRRAPARRRPRARARLRFRSRRVAHRARARAACRRSSRRAVCPGSSRAPRRASDVDPLDAEARREASCRSYAARSTAELKNSVR